MALLWLTSIAMQMSIQVKVKTLLVNQIYSRNIRNKKLGCTASIHGFSRIRCFSISKVSPIILDATYFVNLRFKEDNI